MPQRAVAHTMIAQKFQSIQRLHTFADDAADMLTN